MSGPTVQASITVDDKASPALKELANLARKIAQETANALKPGSGDAYAASFGKANAAAKGHLDALTSIRNMHKEIAAIAGGVIAGKAAHVAKDKVIEYGKYEKDVRYQGIVGHYNPTEQKRLDDQRQKFAKEQGIKPEDTLHAQNAFVARDFSAGIVEAATDKAMVLAKALNIAGEQAAKIVEGKAFGEGAHFDSPEEAAKIIKGVADRAVIMNKRAAMTPEDISQNSKFSAATARVANIRPEQADAYAMTLKRNQIGGEMSGVSFRGLTTHLIAPTAGGLTALDSMGIKHSDYSKAGTLSVDNVDQNLRRKFGKGLGKKGRSYLQEQMDDETSKVLDSDANYAAAGVAAMEKDGAKLSKTDAKNAAKAFREQFNVVRKGFDGAGLWDAVRKADPTLQQLVPLVGPKNAGNVALATGNRDQYDTYEGQLKNSGGISEKIATERNEGLGAALDRLSASTDSAEKNLVKVAAVPLEGVTKFATSLINMGDNLPDSVKMGAMTAGVMGLGAAALASVAGVISLGSSALAAATSLNLLATKGIPGLVPGSVPGGVHGAVPKGGIPAGVAPTVATAATFGSRVAGVLGGVATGLGWAAVLAAVTPIIYAAVNDKAQGVERDGTRPKLARDAIQQDADERMKREIEANDQQAKEAAERGDANVAASTKRDGNGAYRRALRAGGDVVDEAAGLNTNRQIPVTVTGTVDGTATITGHIEVTPSPWFVTKIGAMETAIAYLKGGLNSSKLGTGLNGDGNATRTSAPARTGLGGQ